MRALLWAEMVVLGRAAMGEQVGRLSDSAICADVIRRDGSSGALIEPLQIDHAGVASRGPAGLGGARAMATVALVAPGAEDALDHIRSVRVDDVQIAASAWDGKLIVRALARDALPLRRPWRGF